MAILNVLAKSNGTINWDDLSRYTDLDLSHIEIFPIPKELGFDQDCIGINIHKGYSDKKIVMSELKKAIDFLAPYNLKFIELYDGVEINKDNIVAVADKLLPIH